MLQNNSKIVKNDGYQRIVVVLMFITGLLNSRSYLSFMGLSILSKGLLILFYGLLGFMCSILILNFLLKKKGSLSYSFPYWFLLFLSLILKFTVLFFQFPTSFFPGGYYFSQVITFSSNLLLIIVLTKTLHDKRHLKSVIWAFGIGASFSAVIPLIFFPEMIGSRISLIDDYTFTGAFWNSAVISFMSVGWLLIAESINETKKIKQSLLVGMFVLIVLAALSGLSRAALVSLFISTIVYLIASKKVKHHLKIIIGVVGLSVILYYLFPGVVENFEQRLSGGIDIKEEARTTIWMDYLINIQDYFLLGEVSGDFKKYSPRGFGPHSVLLNWFTQFGILALLGFGILLIGVFKSIKIIRKNESNQIAAALSAWLVAYLSIALINETGFKDFTVFGGIGIILAWGKIVREKDKRG